MTQKIEIQESVATRSDTIEAFRLLADTIPTLCWMADTNGHIYWYNKRWYEYTGLTSEQTHDQDWQKAHDPKDHQHIMEKWKTAFETGEPFDMVVSLKGADGKYRPFLSHIVPSKDDNGNVTGWLGIKNDISKLRDADAALKKSDKKFKMLAEAMPQMAFMANKQGDITYYNQRWYEYVGDGKDTEGWGWKDKPIHHPDDLQRTIDVWNASLASGEDYEIEYRLRRHDGVYRWHLGRATPVRDDNGAISYWIGTNTDIHEQKRQSQNQNFLLEVTEELSKSLSYRETLETITNLCVPEVADWCSIDLLDHKGGFEQVALAHVNPAKVEMAREFRKRNPMRIDDPTGVPQAVRSGETEAYLHIDNAMLEAGIDDADTLQIMKSLQLHSIVVAPIHIKGKPAGAISFITSESGIYYTENDVQMVEDIASRISLAITNALLFEEVQAELDRSQKLERALVEEKEALESRVKSRTRQLQETNEGLEAEVERRRSAEIELQRSNQELQDFAYAASHDLQEPLRKIQAFGDILENEFSDQLGEGAEYLSRMHAAAGRMSKLIEDLLAFSRVTTKQPEPSKIDLNDILDDVISDLENRIKTTNGTVHVDELPVVLADPTHMRQLFQNLIGNALKFHREGVDPEVKVSCSTSKSDDSMYEIIISDNGIGFDKKYAERIFGVFQRLHGRDSYEGTGIGLAICRKIVTRYGGTITAEGMSEKGTTFTINLPKVAKEKAHDDSH